MPAKRTRSASTPKGKPSPAKGPAERLPDAETTRIVAQAGLTLGEGSQEPLMSALSELRAAPSLRDLKTPQDVRESTPALKEEVKRFHGAKASLAWFPLWLTDSTCGDHFGYLSTSPIRKKSKLSFTNAHVDLMNQLGAIMGDAGREPPPLPPPVENSLTPAGFTYFGQFVDHDITLDISSSLDSPTDANTVPNMRSPSLDLDSVYGRGPVLEPYLYDFPAGGPPTAIKLKLGSNSPIGPGGPAGPSATPAGMVQKSDFDVPRIPGTQTAVIGDPRNDENLIVTQFHHAMLRFHNKVVDMLVAVPFAGDIFVEAKKIVRHHYQWAVVHDFLERICGPAAVSAALSGVTAPIGSSFRMPVEFSVAAYRFGHSMIRDQYWVNFNFPNATLGQVFAFARMPNLPVFSNWVVDFNAFFDTGVPVPVHNKIRPIDSVLANGLESLPGFSGMMAELASRNLRRGLALGLPSGQGMAEQFGIASLTGAQIKAGLPANEVALLDMAGKTLLKKTPLWYYVLREAAVLEGGKRLGPVGARIVAETFIRILKRDGDSYLNAPGTFIPFLPSDTPSTFKVADLIKFAGVHLP